MADARDNQDLDAIVEELVDRFGELPVEASTLIEVAQLRVRAKQLGLSEVVIQGKFLKLAPVTLPESLQLRLMRMYPGSLIKAATESIMVARAASPNWQAGGDLVDTSILPWTMEVLNSILK